MEIDVDVNGAGSSRMPTNRMGSEDEQEGSEFHSLFPSANPMMGSKDKQEPIGLVQASMEGPRITIGSGSCDSSGGYILNEQSRDEPCEGPSTVDKLALVIFMFSLGVPDWVGYCLWILRRW